MVNNWNNTILLVGGDWNHGFLWLSIQLEISSSQLTSYIDIPTGSIMDIFWLVVEPYPSEKLWSSSVGMMKFPTEWNKS